MNMEPRKQAILDALDAFTRQRAGLDYRNYCSGYGDVNGRKAYFAEQRSITRDLHDYRALRKAVGYADSITADMLLDASRSAFSGRLVLNESLLDTRPSLTTVGTAAVLAVKIEYCTGQYFPTEYRKAACAVLAAALWDWTRERCMPAPTQWRVESWARLGAERERSKPMQINAACELLAQKGGQAYGHVQDYIAGKTPGDWLRAHFRQQFGRGIASRYFN
jgi:hypothetical protein